MTYVPAIRTLSGTNTGDQTNIAGNAATATTATSATTAATATNALALASVTPTAAGLALLDDAAASNQRTTLGLGTVATLDSDADTTLAANSDAKVATQKAVKAYVDGATPTVPVFAIFPFSQIPVTTDRTYWNVHVGAGSNSKHTEGMGVEASVGADSIWRLRLKFPTILPPGKTCKLVLEALANATSGNAKINPKWASVAAEEAPDAATLQAETTQTLSWGAGDNDQIKQLKVTLGADTPVAGEWCVMDLTFETSSWTLAQVSTWIAYIIFE